MKRLKIFEEFYTYLKSKRNWKEHHWHFKKSNITVRFGHKEHIFTFFAFLSDGDPNTIFVDEQGTRKIQKEEWEWLIATFQKYNRDVLLVFRNEFRNEDDYKKVVATGEKSERMAQFYETLLNHTKNHRPIRYAGHPGDERRVFVVPISKRFYPVYVSFEWKDSAIRLKDTPRRLDKTFHSVDELARYLWK